MSKIVSILKEKGLLDFLHSYVESEKDIEPAIELETRMAKKLLDDINNEFETFRNMSMSKKMEFYEKSKKDVSFSKFIQYLTIAYESKIREAKLNVYGIEEYCTKLRQGYDHVRSGCNI